MSKGGGSTRTITQQTAAPEYAQPFLKYGLSEAQRLYESPTPQYYPESTVVGFSPETEMALSSARQRAISGSPLIGQAQQAYQTAAMGGMQNLALPYAQRLAGGVDFSRPMSAFESAAMGGYTSEALPLARQLSGGISLSEPIEMTRRTAAGEFLGGTPQRDLAIERALRPVQERLEGQLSQAGRYGSGYGQQAMARELGGIAADIAYSDYQRERANQLAAQQNLAALQQAQYGSAMQGLGALSGESAADIQRRLAAQQQIAQLQEAGFQTGLSGLGALGGLSSEAINRQLQAAGQLPQLSELDYLGAQRLSEVGAAREAQAGAELAANIERFQFEQARPYQKLGDYLQMVQGGSGALGGQTITPQYVNRAAGALSGALGATTAAANFLPAGAGFGAYAPFAIGGGLLGMMG